MHICIKYEDSMALLEMEKEEKKKNRCHFKNVGHID